MTFPLRPFDSPFSKALGEEFEEEEEEEEDEDEEKKEEGFGCL